MNLLHHHECSKPETRGKRKLHNKKTPLLHTHEPQGKAIKKDKKERKRKPPSPVKRTSRPTNNDIEKKRKRRRNPQALKSNPHPEAPMSCRVNYNLPSSTTHSPPVTPPEREKENEALPAQKKRNLASIPPSKPTKERKTGNSPTNHKRRRREAKKKPGDSL